MASKTRKTRSLWARRSGRGREAVKTLRFYRKALAGYVRAYEEKREREVWESGEFFEGSRARLVQRVFVNLYQ